MNIAHVYPSVKRMHGATKWLLLFATSLTQKGHSNTIFCVSYNIQTPRWFKGQIKALIKKNVSVEETGFSKLFSIAQQIIAVFLIPFKIPHDTDVIVLHSEISLFALFIAKFFFRKKKIIYYCYQPPRELYDLSHVAKQTYGFWYSILTPFFRLYKTVDKILVKAADSVLVWSDEAQACARSIYGDVRMYNVPAGVDFGVFNMEQDTHSSVSDLRKELDLEGKKILLMNAALTRKKNIPIFLRLLKRFQKENMQVHGIIIGEGPEKDSLEKMAQELGIADHASLLGFVTQRNLPLYYHLADILFYLEPNGIWTMSIIEAGAAKIPVIVASGGSMETLVDHGKTGFVLNSSHIESELFERTLYLLENNEIRLKMGRENFFHSKQFSAESSASRFLDIVQ